MLWAKPKRKNKQQNLEALEEPMDLEIGKGEKLQKNLPTSAVLLSASPSTSTLSSYPTAYFFSALLNLTNEEIMWLIIMFLFVLGLWSFVFLGPHLQHMDISRLEVELEL